MLSLNQKKSRRRSQPGGGSEKIKREAKRGLVVTQVVKPVWLTQHRREQNTSRARGDRERALGRFEMSSV